MGRYSAVSKQLRDGINPVLIEHFESDINCFTDCLLLVDRSTAAQRYGAEGETDS